jgi:hypothetical protein
VDNHGIHLTNATDSITVTNLGTLPPGPVIINEWMAANAGPGGFADPLDGLFQDWFELYNPNDAAVNLSGFQLTDDFSAQTDGRYLPTPSLPHGFCSSGLTTIPVRTVSERMAISMPILPWALAAIGLRTRRTARRSTKSNSERSRKTSARDFSQMATPTDSTRCPTGRRAPATGWARLLRRSLAKSLCKRTESFSSTDVIWSNLSRGIQERPNACLDAWRNRTATGQSGDF